MRSEVVHVRSCSGIVVVVATALAAMVLQGCQKKGPDAAIAQFVLSDSPALSRLESAGLGREEVRNILLQGFSSASGAVPVEEPAKARPEGQGLRVRLTVAYAQVTADTASIDFELTSAGKVEVGVELELTAGRAESPLRESGQWATRVDSSKGLGAALRQSLSGAAKKGSEALSLAWKADQKSEKELLADLESIDARVRDYAIRVLADRKNPAAVPALIERLEDPDEEVVERSIGALAQLEDSRAVEPLIELSQRREPSTVAQIARIIGDIGGMDAEAYLVTLASGHPDPSVREAASEALSGMRARPAANEKREAAHVPHP